jgi:hypothetical protein
MSESHDDIAKNETERSFDATSGKKSSANTNRIEVSYIVILAKELTKKSKLPAFSVLKGIISFCLVCIWGSKAESQ